jgi:hypothetical protein
MQQAKIGELFEARIGFRVHSEEEEELFKKALEKSYDVLSDDYGAPLTDEEEWAYAGQRPSKAFDKIGEDHLIPDTALEDEERRNKKHTALLVDHSPRYPSDSPNRLFLERQARLARKPWWLSKAKLVEGRLDIWTVAFPELWSLFNEVWNKSIKEFDLMFTYPFGGVASIPMHRLRSDLPVFKVLWTSPREEGWNLVIEVVPADSEKTVTVTSRFFNHTKSKATEREEKEKRFSARPNVVGVRVPAGTPMVTVALAVLALRYTGHNELAEALREYHGGGLVAGELKETTVRTFEL